MALRELCHQRVLKQLIGQTRRAVEIGPNRSSGGAFCALVTDDLTLRVLSSCTKVYDALDAGVSVVELITKSRQALPQLDALYFLTPTAESIEGLARDFKNDKKPQYRSAHVFWSTSIALNPDIMTVIQSQGSLLSRIQSFMDFNFHFIAYESRAFHLDMPQALIKLFPSVNDAEQSPFLREMANRLATVGVSLGDKPSVRFHVTARGLPEIVAKYTQAYLSKINPEGITRGQTELIILDRSIDACGLLVHEYTYQALAYDVLDIPCCTTLEQRSKMSDEVPPDDTYQFLDRKELQTLVLGEHDDIFVKYRHQHITVVSRGVSEELRKFSRDNAAAQYAAAGGKKASEKDIAGAIRGLPQYKEMLTRVSIATMLAYIDAQFLAHITLADSCFNSLQQQGVFKAGGLEQDLATGVDKEGKLVQVMNCLQTLGTLVAEKSGVQTAEKARLLLLYFVNMDGVQEDDMKKMMGAAGLSLDISAVVNGFLSLGLHCRDETFGSPVGVSQPPYAMSDRPLSEQSSLKHTHKLHADSEKEKVQFFQRKARDSDYELSRYEPVVKDLMERAAGGRLNRAKYPFVQDPDGRQAGQMNTYGQSEEGGRGARVRAVKFDWDWSNDQDGVGDYLCTDSVYDTFYQTVTSDTLKGNGNLAAKVLNGSKKKIIFFIIGGVTFAEIRSAYDVSKTTGTDVYIGTPDAAKVQRCFCAGGTSILTPPAVFEALRRSKDQGWG